MGEREKRGKNLALAFATAKRDFTYSRNRMIHGMCPARKAGWPYS